MRISSRQKKKENLLGEEEKMKCWAEIDFGTLSFFAYADTKSHFFSRKGQEWNKGVYWRFVARYVGFPGIPFICPDFKIFLKEMIIFLKLPFLDIFT